MTQITDTGKNSDSIFSVVLVWLMISNFIILCISFLLFILKASVARFWIADIPLLICLIQFILGFIAFILGLINISKRTRLWQNGLRAVIYALLFVIFPIFLIIADSFARI